MNNLHRVFNLLITRQPEECKGCPELEFSNIGIPKCGHVTCRPNPVRCHKDDRPRLWKKKQEAD